MSIPSRVQPGVPSGGQFAARGRDEPGVTLMGGHHDYQEDALNDGRCPDCGQWTSPNEVHVCGRMTALASRMDEVQHKVDLANSKLRRHGIPGTFTVEVLGRYTQDRTEEGGVVVQRELVDYRIDRPALKIGGWTFAGRLDTLPDGTPVAMTVPDVELHGYRPETMECDHCHTTRARKSTYLLRGDDGAVRQVGSTCLEAFTGIQPKGLWALDWEPELPDLDDDRDGMSGGGWERTATPNEILRMALAVTDNGKSYLSRRRAEYGLGTPTGAVVTDYLWPHPKLASDDDYRDSVAKAASAETGQMADEVLEYAKGVDGDDDYPTNLRAVAAQERLTTKHIGLLASAVAGWHRDRERRAKEAAEAANPGVNEWIGKVKDKLTDVKATITGVRYLPGDYGTTTLITFRDSDGHTLKWFASGEKDVDEGDSVTISRATIKGHDEWNGTKQTVLTRAKMQPAGDAA